MPYLPARYLAFLIAGFVFLLALALALLGGEHWWLAVPSGALTLVGVIDLCQTRQALRRNYPILAHFRYFFESIRPEIRLYFLEDDTDAKPLGSSGVLLGSPMFLAGPQVLFLPDTSLEIQMSCGSRAPPTLPGWFWRAKYSVRPSGEITGWVST